jgi:predicted kinase
LIDMSDRTRPRPAPPTPIVELIGAITAQSPCVVVLLGAPGAGKSTLATVLAEQMANGTAVLSYAAHRAEVSGDPADPAADPAAGALLMQRLAARCAAGLTTVLDGTHHLASTRATLLGIAADAGLPAVAVVLSTPLAVCLRRQQDRPPPAPGKHGLRIPEPQVRELDRVIQDARTGLGHEGFVVYVLDPDATTSEQR